MRIVNLIENTSGTEGCLYEHGLSFYIETKNHKLLVDTGASEAFIHNAKMLGIDLTKVDTVILSHGHYDHSGGILAFVKMNSKARIYIQKNAVGDYYHKDAKMEKYIGIDKDIANLSQVVLVDGNLRLDDELELFSHVTGRRLWPQGNLELKELMDGAFIQDEFSHEQYLVIIDGEKKLLVSGCAHNGVLNILEKYRELYGENPYAMISGFHMRKKTDYTEEDVALMEETAKELCNTDTVFYTGHCTGEFPFEVMKKILGRQLIYVHSGEEVVCG
ncbi:MAG: MBL fold metallo-hydrolase [Lachnospiraceae bacterium]|nr:MBL fold metallo-hydrolase [Lachnospiraceae bacterium]